MKIIFRLFLPIVESVEDVQAEGWVISSESCGFLSIGARYVREVSFRSIEITS